jgi:hypothetical protein
MKRLPMSEDAEIGRRNVLLLTLEEIITEKYGKCDHNEKVDGCACCGAWEVYHMVSTLTLPNARRIIPAASLEWTVAFSVIPAGKRAGDELKETVVTVWAESSIEALKEAVASVRTALGDGDLIHEVQVSPPRKSKSE